MSSKKDSHCVDCGVGITRKSARCRSCANRKRWADGVFDNEDYRRKQAQHTKKRWEQGDFDHIHDEEQRRRNAEAIRAAHARGVYGEAWRRQKSEAMKRAYGRGELFTEEHRHKLAKRAKERWESGDLGNDKWKQKVSEAVKAAWARGAYEDSHGEEWSHKISKKQKENWAKGIYDGVFQSPTSIERQVAAALDIMSIEHTPQYRAEGSGWVFDEFIPPAIFIEVQGDYWHSLPENQQRDAEKARWAQSNGFEIIEIWEHEISARGAWSIIANLAL